MNFGMRQTGLFNSWQSLSAPKEKRTKSLKALRPFFRRQITVCHKKLEGTAFFFQDFLKKD